MGILFDTYMVTDYADRHGINPVEMLDQTPIGSKWDLNKISEEINRKEDKEDGC